MSDSRLGGGSRRVSRRVERIKQKKYRHMKTSFRLEVSFLCATELSLYVCATQSRLRSFLCVCVQECVTLWRGIRSACMQVWCSRNVRVHFFTSPHTHASSFCLIFFVCLVSRCVYSLVFAPLAQNGSVCMCVCVLVVNFSSLYCCYFKFPRRRRRRLPFEEKFIISLRLITTFRKIKNKNKHGKEIPGRLWWS